MKSCSMTQESRSGASSQLCSRDNERGWPFDFTTLTQAMQLPDGARATPFQCYDVLGKGGPIRHLTGARADALIAVFVFPPCLIAIALATFWAALGMMQPFLRLAVVELPTFDLDGALVLQPGL